MISEVKRLTLGESIYQELRKEIVSLTLKPGEMIYENDLSKRFNVSRTPVRQALFMLSKEQLVNILPQRGAQVAFLSRKKFKEAQKIREILESVAFKDAAEIWHSDDPTFKIVEMRMIKSIENQKNAAINDDYITFVFEDEVFHNQVLELSNNQTLLEIFYELRAHLNRLRYLEIVEAKHYKASTEQHEELLNLLKSNQTKKVEKYLIQHLSTLEKKREAIFEKYGEYFID